MRRLLIIAAIVLLTAPAVWAMNTDDIIALCQAGFEPQRIAHIIDAAGLDKPLSGADWARLKSEGCGDDVIDALLAVLVPTDETGDSETTAESQTPDRNRDVNVYVGNDWGWSGWYGSMVWGYDPYWSIGWSNWDPLWNWQVYAWDPYWSDPWWHPWWHQQYSCWSCYDPFYFHGRHYVGGYYNGHYAVRKAFRRADHGLSVYAVGKTSPAARRVEYTTAAVKTYRVGTATTAYHKPVRAGTTTVRTGAVTTHRVGGTSTTYTTRLQAQRREAGGTTGTRTTTYGVRKTTKGRVGNTGVATPRTGTTSRPTVRTPSQSSGTTSHGQPAARKKTKSSGGTDNDKSSYRYTPAARPSGGYSSGGRAYTPQPTTSARAIPRSEPRSAGTTARPRRSR